MKKSIFGKLISLLVISVLLMTLMLSQFASAWDEVGSAWDVTGAYPYNTSTADDYYCTSEKYYSNGKLEEEYTYDNEYNDFGFLSKQTSNSVSYSADGNSTVSKSETAYEYDDQGRVIRMTNKSEYGQINTDYTYRDDGSYMRKSYGDPLGRTVYELTFDPTFNNYMWGDVQFQYDDKGRKTRMYEKYDDGDVETIFSYVDDKNGNTLKKNYTVKTDGKVTESGSVTYTYSDNEKTQTETIDNQTRIITFNSNNQIVTARRLDENGNTTQSWKYSYDKNGNTTLIENLLYNHRIEFEYEYHPKTMNGILKGPDGKWAMYKNGKVDTSYTGIAKNDYGWWRVEKGYVNFNAQGIYKNEYGWWKTTDGKVTFKETGVFKNEYGWWRVKDSKVDFKANGIYKNQYGWWKTTDGKVTFKENGVFKNEYGWWKVTDSKVDFNYNGTAKNDYGTWYIKNGKVDFSFNGTYNGYQFKDGKQVGKATIKKQNTTKANTNNKPFVADTKTGIVHDVNCKTAKAISSSRRVYFSSLDEAFAKGYVVADDCFGK